MYKYKVTLIIVLLYLCNISIAADQYDATFDIQNDTFTNSDRHFTSGLRLTFSWTNFDKTEENIIGINTTGLRIGNDIYTPNEIELRPEEIPDNDRPYAGWLYVSTFKETVDSDEYYKRYELSIGCLGPCSYSETLQTEWHEIIGADSPEGWSTQIKNDPTLMFTFSNRKLWKKDEESRLWDLSYGMEGLAGSPFTSLSGKGIFRLALGYMNSYLGSGIKSAPDIPVDIPIDDEEIDPDESELLLGSPDKLETTHKGWLGSDEAFFYIQLEPKLVLFNATIEGGIFGSETDFVQNSRTSVVGSETGVVFNWKPVSVSLSFSTRSTEIKEQSWSLLEHKWGNIQAQFHF